MIRVSEEVFCSIVEAAILRLPAEFRRRLANVAIMVEPDSPSPGLFGYYHGVPLPQRSVQDSYRMPDRIVIFQAPHERAAQDRSHLEELVFDTVWHEVAHYFGMSESEVRRWEKRRGASFSSLRERLSGTPSRRRRGTPPDPSAGA